MYNFRCSSTCFSYGTSSIVIFQFFGFYSSGFFLRRRRCRRVSHDYLYMVYLCRVDSLFFCSPRRVSMWLLTLLHAPDTPPSTKITKTKQEYFNNFFPVVLLSWWCLHCHTLFRGWYFSRWEQCGKAMRLNKQQFKSLITLVL